MRMVLRVLLSLFIAGCLTIPSVVYAEQLTVVVMPFGKGGNLKLSYYEERDVLNGITQLITDKLANEPDLRVVERSRIAEIIKEQHFQYSGMVDSATAVELGRLVGADLMIAGTLNEFGWESKKGLSIGGFTIKTSTARVKLSGRLIATQTGEILASLQSVGEESGAALSVDALKGISFGGSEFSNSTLGKALSKAIDNFISQFQSALADAKKKLVGDLGETKLSGSVIAIKGSYIIVDVGKEDGVTEETRFAVYHLEKIEGLEEPVRIPAGTLQVISVDPHASVAKLVSGEVKPGDAVEIAE